MVRLLALFLMSGLPFGDTNAETWIDKGKHSYAAMNLAGAAEDFEKAVSVDPKSVEARLCYGVACLFLYQNGMSTLQPRYLDPRSTRRWSDQEVQAERTRIESGIAEENATHGKRAEENLRMAIQLNPRNKVAMEYLAVLYSRWIDATTDPLGNKRRLRLPESIAIYKQILAIDPDDKSALYACGAIEWERSFDLMRASGYPRPPTEDTRRSLLTQVSPLLDDASRNLRRTLEYDPDNFSSMIYLASVTNAQAYLAANATESARLKSESDEWNRKVNQILESRAKAAGQPWPPGPSASITFRRIPETAQTPGKSATPQFPPDIHFLLPLAIPPPPPPPPKSEPK